MTQHEPNQIMPDLDQAIQDALRETIIADGIIVPIVVDQHGTIIDGHHRRHIADDLGIECPQITITVDDPNRSIELAAKLNLVRRHMDIDQRRAIVARLRSEGHSLRSIGKALGVSLGAIQNDLRSGVLPNTPETVTGADGKTYPATRPKPDPEPEDRVMPVAVAALDDLLADIEGTEHRCCIATSRSQKDHTAAYETIMAAHPTQAQVLRECFEQRHGMDAKALRLAACILMGEHPDVVEQVVADSSDDAVTMQKVLDAIETTLTG